jgi:hypothetical protein
MPPGDEYKRRVAECLLLAAEQTDPHRKAAMLEMARVWSRLADQAVKNNQNDITYETPPRREP